MKYKAYEVEYEAGGCSRIDEIHEFDTKEARDNWVRDYNERNIKPLKPGESVPGWYMIAEAAIP